MSNDKRPEAIIAQTSISNNLDAIIAEAESESSMWIDCSLDQLITIPRHAGVYFFLLPQDALPKDQKVTLHGRTFGSSSSKRQFQFSFRYEASSFRSDEDLLIYVGKSSNLRKRIQQHLYVSPGATTNQVLKGMTGIPSHKIQKTNLESAKDRLVASGKVFYYVHQHPDERQELNSTNDMGISYVADRDLLEIKLIAKYAPPFNIKAER